MKLTRQVFGDIYKGMLSIFPALQLFLHLRVSFEKKPISFECLFDAINEKLFKTRQWCVVEQNWIISSMMNYVKNEILNLQSINFGSS